MARTVELLDDPARFLRAAAPLLAADPVRASVLATVSDRRARLDAAGEPRPDHPWWWALVRDERGSVVSGAMRTSPQEGHPVWVQAMPDDAARLLARTLMERGETVRTVKGNLAAAAAFAAAVAEATGGTVVPGRPDRLWEATTVREPRRTPSGSARRATTADLDVVAAWLGVFHGEADAQAGREPGPSEIPDPAGTARARVAEGRVWLWEADGEPVHLSAVNPASFGVARIGPVYTPPAHRGRGYASALVAHLSRQVLDAGDRVCLYTDADNPVSNRVYAAIGYEPLEDQGALVVRY